MSTPQRRTHRLDGQPSGVEPRSLQRERNTNTYSGLHHGGFSNPAAGIGGVADKSQSGFFTPTRFWWQTPLEILAVQSWAARKFVSIPVNDQFWRWRRFTGDQETAISDMKEAEQRHKLRRQLAKAMRAARLYGSAVIVIMSKDAPPTTELIPERIRPGDLGNLMVLNRYEMAVPQRINDMYDPNFGQPEFYDLFPQRGGNLTVHHSRIVRFDGITPETDSGFVSYDWDWGVSELVPVILALTQDQQLVSAISYLSLEASIPILGVAGLQRALAGEFKEDDPDAVDLEAIGSRINQAKSNHRLFMLDKTREEFHRVAVMFSGLADLIDRFEGRVAAAADIPETRWRGRSPAGMNATGESDMANYVMMVESLREQRLPDPLRVLDMVLARDAGLAEPLEYEWLSLLEMGERERAELSQLAATATDVAIKAGTMDEDEGRAALNNLGIFPDLEGPAPEPPEPEFDPNFGGPGVGGPPQPNDNA